MEPITRIEKLYDAIARGGTIDFEPVTREEKFLYEILKKGIGNGEGGGIFVEGATVGQTVKISAVDENGVPTAWEPVNFPSGGGNTATTVILDNTLTEDVTNFTITKDKDGNELNVDLDANVLCIDIYYPSAFTVQRMSRINEQNWVTANVLDQVALEANYIWTHKIFVTRIGGHRIVASCAERTDLYISPNNPPKFLQERTRQHDQYINFIQIGTCTIDWNNYIVPKGTRIHVYIQGR